MPSSYFISDLHLSDNHPAVVQLFESFLLNKAPQADALYILGDLFDAWVGDDDDSQTAMRTSTALSKLADHNTGVFIMHGNRDFLIGKDFCEASQATLLHDPTIVTINNSNILLTHGDQMCTGDIAYQRARQMRLDEKWLTEFTRQSLAERRKIAEQYRQQSGEAKSLLAADIMDVTQSAVENWFMRYDVSLMIHGHTHRPADHTHQVDGKTRTRVVLDQWHHDRGMYLEMDGVGKISRHSITH